MPVTSAPALQLLVTQENLVTFPFRFLLSLANRSAFPRAIPARPPTPPLISTAFGVPQPPTLTRFSLTDLASMQ
jgi:hypothetical protein